MAVQTKSLTENVESEMSLIMTVAVIMIFAVLCITTNAWAEPFLFLLVMGVAILLNRGTNIFIGTVSFSPTMWRWCCSLPHPWIIPSSFWTRFPGERAGGFRRKRL